MLLDPSNQFLFSPYTIHFLPFSDSNSIVTFSNQSITTIEENINQIQKQYQVKQRNKRSSPWQIKRQNFGLTSEKSITGRERIQKP